MQDGRLDALFLFQQESMFWLTGYDTFGFCFFQCLVVKADGTMALLTRSADLRQAQQTSNLTDIRVWKDGRDADPSADLLALTRDLGLAGKRIGVEFEAYGLVASNYRKLEARFAGQAERRRSLIVTRLRAVKSAEEIAYVRRAAVLADAADRAALAAIGPAPTRAKSSPPSTMRSSRAAATTPPTSSLSAPAATPCSAATNPGGAGSMRTTRSLEFAGTDRHYHVAAMRTVVVGEPRPLHRPYHAAARDALLACEAELKPGRTAATSSPPMPASSTNTASRSTDSMPAAIRWAPSSRRHGWIGRCSTRRMTGRSCRAW
jgi:Xaa-Pro dipeptidase